MEAHPECKKLDDISHVTACGMDNSSDQIAQEADENSKLPIELTNITGTYPHHMDDSCLQEIFSVKSLTLMDLCALAETCKRFQQIAERAFPKDLKIYVGNNGNYLFGSRNFLYNENRSSDDIERILKNFGSFVTEILISSCNYASEEPAHLVLNLLTKYCADTLERLTIIEMKIPEFLTAKLKPIFKRLEIIDIRNVAIMDAETLFAECTSLIELRVCMIENGRAILENNFPKLERFIYEKVPIGSRDNRELSDQAFKTLSTFISRHTNLNTLILHVNIYDWRCKYLNQVIGNSCKKLKELSISVGREKGSYLQPLKALHQSLNTLTIWGAFCEDLTFISALTKLRELHLCYGRKPINSNKFAYSTQLTKLHLYHMMVHDSYHVVDIIKRLINLEEFTVSEEFVLDEKTYSKIVAVVKERPNVLRLKCKYNFVDPKNCDKKQRVKLI